jgi:dihydrofolate synthase/folylpolyglutamate synthase
MKYEKAVETLTSQGKFYINLGLERVLKVLKLLNNPQEKIKVIHVAGTNGKGSVCSVLANVLKCAGYKIGLYTSPHLIKYTERIKINNVDISKEDFANYVEQICNLADKNEIPLTEFEILTICAFKYFADNKVNIAIIETGLGGRFDATNVCKKPLLSIITSISFDHLDRLGNTIDEIAFEKAGIIKQNSTVITEISNKGFKVIKKVAEEKNAKLDVVANYVQMEFKNGINYALIEDIKFEFPLIGSYQKSNLSLVLKALEYFKVDKKALEEGLKTVHWAGRLEFIKDKNLLIDGAHNPDAAYELKKSLKYYWDNQKKIFIYSTLKTKDYKTIAKILFSEDDEIYFYEFNHKDAVKFDEYKKNNPQLKNLHKFNVEDLNLILKRKELKIVTGSLYMIGNIYTKLID